MLPAKLLVHEALDAEVKQEDISSVRLQIVYAILIFMAVTGRHTHHGCVKINRLARHHHLVCHKQRRFSGGGYRFRLRYFCYLLNSLLLILLALFRVALMLRCWRSTALDCTEVFVVKIKVHLFLTLRLTRNLQFFLLANPVINRYK